MTLTFGGEGCFDKRKGTKTEISPELNVINEMSKMVSSRFRGIFLGFVWSLFEK